MRKTAILQQLFRTDPMAVLRRKVKFRLFSASFSVALMVAWPLSSGAQVFTGMQRAQVPVKRPNLTMRSIAVVEWSGPESRLTDSWLVPIAVYTNGEYMDGGGYLADPVPLAVESGTLYVLEKAGVPQKIYTLGSPQKMPGAWLGRGSMAALPAASPDAEPYAEAGSGRPHYFRSQSGKIEPVPTLQTRAQNSAGKPRATEANARITAMVHPAGTMVAISDASQVVERPLVYRWPTAAAKAAMQQRVEGLAEKFLAQALLSKTETKSAPVAPVNFPLRNVDFRCFALTAEKKVAQKVPTCIFSAENDAASGVARYVMIIARADIYGKPVVLAHATTDSTQLESHPRVHLVDAVSVAAGQPAELLLEFDGKKTRRFALYGLENGQLQLDYATEKLPF